MSSVCYMYFSDKFIENDFVSERLARDVFSKTGVSGGDKDSELLHKVTVNYKSTQENQVWAEKFIAVFYAEAAYTELAAQLRAAFIIYRSVLPILIPCLLQSQNTCLQLRPFPLPCLLPCRPHPPRLGGVPAHPTTSSLCHMTSGSPL